ncbi:MAG TPA: 16S rRNA (cytidine(1402)-2'-O)-methyltransferase [Chloroflexota bacterium]
MPRLVVVPTPIGNLEDITLRALRALNEVDLVLAEDTRHTRRLFSHFGISTRLLSYHQHNKIDRLATVLRTLEGADVALVSNAGTPAVSDPGFELINAVIREGIELDVLPGASALVTAVVGAALPAPGFVFGGFLPRRAAQRREHLAGLAALPETLIFYEAPHRILAVLADMLAVLGNRRMVVARELTKVHQEWVRGTIAEIADRYAAETARGEMTLVIAGALQPQSPDRGDAESEMRKMRERGEARQVVLDAISASHGLSRNEAYRLWLSLDAEHPAD